MDARCIVPPHQSVYSKCSPSRSTSYPLDFPVYYKLFDEEKLSQVRSPISSDDQYIGRVDTTLIPPPHTIGLLVKRICNQEGKGFGIDWDNDNAFSTILFRTISASEPFDLNDSVQLLTAERPGSSPLEPIILKTAYKGVLNPRCPSISVPKLFTSDVRDLFGLWSDPLGPFRRLGWL